MTIKEHIINYCEANNITKKEFVRRSGVSETMVRKYMNGSRFPGLGNAKLLAKTLGITLDELAKDYD